MLLEMTAETVERMISMRGEAARGIMRELCRRMQSMIRERVYEDTGSFAIVQAGRVPEPAAVPAAALADVEKAVLLKTVNVFSSLPDPVLLHLASLAREQWLDAGSSIFRSGDAGTSMFVIVEGEVAVHDEDRMIASLGRGKIIGEMALLTSETRSTSITVLQPTRLLRISQQAMEELMWDHAQMSRSLIHVLTSRLRNMISGQAA